MKTLAILKQSFVWGAIGSTVLLTSIQSKALTVEEVVNPQQANGSWVTDMADILDETTEAKLNSLIDNLEQDNGTEIAVVTVPDTATSPKAFATELFNYWGIGKAESDNGILFLISYDDRRVEIETGHGIEEILPDAEVSNIIDTQIVPQYKKGNFDRGTLNGTKAMISALDSTTNSKYSNKPTSEVIDRIQGKDANSINNDFGNFIATFVAVMAGLSFIVASASAYLNSGSNNKTNNKRSTNRRSSNSSFYGGYSSGGSSSGGSSSGGGFGGGSSDGGGAGGSW